MSSRVAVPGTVTAGVLPVSAINNLPGGWIGYTSITSDSNQWNTTATDITGLSVTVTVNTNRRLLITATGVLELGAAAAVADIYLWRDVAGTFGTPAPMVKRRFGGGNGLAQATFTVIDEDAPTLGQHTYSLRGDRVTGTVNQYVTASPDAGSGYGPAWIMVQDVGPAS